MTGTEAALIISSIATLITSMTAAVLSLRNGFNIKRIEVATNHMKDALVESTAKASHAEGLAEGKAQRPDPPHSLPEDMLPPVWPEKPK